MQGRQDPRPLRQLRLILTSVMRCLPQQPQLGLCMYGSASIELLAAAARQCCLPPVAEQAHLQLLAGRAPAVRQGQLSAWLHDAQHGCPADRHAPGGAGLRGAAAAAGPPLLLHGLALAPHPAPPPHAVREALAGRALQTRCKHRPVVSTALTCILCHTVQAQSAAHRSIAQLEQTYRSNETATARVRVLVTLPRGRAQKRRTDGGGYCSRGKFMA